MEHVPQIHLWSNSISLSIVALMFSIRLRHTTILWYLLIIYMEPQSPQVELHKNSNTNNMKGHRVEVLKDFPKNDRYSRI